MKKLLRIKGLVVDSELDGLGIDQSPEDADFLFDPEAIVLLRNTEVKDGSPATEVSLLGGYEIIVPMSMDDLMGYIRKYYDGI